MSVEREVVAILERAFGPCEVTEVVALNGGISARAVVAHVRLPTGASQRVVIRRPPYECALQIVQREARVLQLAASAAVAVPRVRHLDTAAAALVLDHVAGNPDFAPRDLQGSLRQMATTLARIHQLPIGADPQLPRRAERLDEALRQTPASLDAALDEGAVRATLGRHWPWAAHNAEVLLHGDYWPGNLVWQEGKLAAVLDWEETSIGDPLADLAVARLDILWAFGQAAMTEFTQFYRAQTALDWRNMALWDLAVGLRPMSKLDAWASAYASPPIARPDITEHAMAAGHRSFIAQALQALMS